MTKILIWLGFSLGVISATAQITVTTTGGTNGYVPVFTGSSTIVNSAIVQSNGMVAIGYPTGGSNALAVNGVINAGGNYYNVLTYAYDGTPTNGIKMGAALLHLRLLRDLSRG